MRPTALRLYRAAIVIALIWLVHVQARWLDAQRSHRISLAQARKIFPGANRVQLRDPERGLHYVTDARGNTLGLLLTTSPQTDDIIGYSGPNNLLLALDTNGAMAAAELISSGDTEEHVTMIRRDPGFLRAFVGWKPGEIPPRFSAVSGATLTSYAMAEAIQKRLAGSAPSLRFPEPLAFAEVQKLFTNAASVIREDRRHRVLDSSGHLLGFVARTSPEADNVGGYRGPTEALVALAPDGRTVKEVRILGSYDTPSYVDQVRDDSYYLKLFAGRTIEEITALDYKRERIEGVSGATQTSWALAEGMKRHFAAALKATAPTPQWRPKFRDVALAAVAVGAVVMAFTSLRGKRWVRIAWQTLLILYVGLISGDLLSLALLGGWAADGLPWEAAPGLVLLAAAALFLPWVTRRQVYCHHLCPHGAAQQWLGALGRRIRSRHFIVPRRVSAALKPVPLLLLLFALVVVLQGAPFNLAALEPFHAWTWRAAGAATIAIAVIGLVAALFVPQAYCRFGCPTGALLNFVRSSGSADHWGTRDWGGLILLLVGMVTVGATRFWPTTEPVPEPTVFRGDTMGTTWSVRIRDELADPAAVEKALAEQFEWCEQMTSHWRSNTDLSIFNRARSTDPIPVPWPVVTLARQSAEISRASEGAFDITVGPLVRLWGFGPAPRRETPPDETDITRVQRAVGWQKLEVLDGQLRKQIPELEVDLSAIAKGWAIDQVAGMLARRGFNDFLVEAGGELRASGVWTVAIEHPPRTLTLTNEALATSGTYRQNWKSEARAYSHLLDPRTGRPVTHRTVSVSVRHRDCASADAWATALNVLGAEAGLPLAQRLGLNAQFVLERSDRTLEIRVRRPPHAPASP